MHEALEQAFIRSAQKGKARIKLWSVDIAYAVQEPGVLSVRHDAEIELTCTFDFRAGIAMVNSEFKMQPFLRPPLLPSLRLQTLLVRLL